MNMVAKIIRQTLRIANLIMNRQGMMSNLSRMGERREAAKRPKQ
jgi:hypothetical protein